MLGGGCYDPYDADALVASDSATRDTEVPPGWDGILVEWNATDPNACPVEQTVVLVRDLQARAAICRGCRHAADPSWCTRARVVVHANSTCDDEPYRILGEGRDGSIWVWPSDARAVSLQPALAQATCALVTHPLQEVEPVRAGFRLDLCATQATATPHRGRQCIVRPGLHLCPLGWTDDVGEAAMGWRDDRGCSPCETPELEPSLCSAGLIAADKIEGEPSVRSCLSAGPTSFSLALAITASPCPSRGWQPQGSVEAGPLVTYCCRRDP